MGPSLTVEVNGVPVVEAWPTRDADVEADQLSWSIPCSTYVDHGDGPPPENPAEDAVKVLVLGDRVAVIMPPGDTLVFDSLEATTFADRVEEAVRNAGAPS